MLRLIFCLLIVVVGFWLVGLSAACGGLGDGRRRLTHAPRSGLLVADVMNLPGICLQSRLNFINRAFSSTAFYLQQKKPLRISAKGLFKSMKQQLERQ